jgi:hypothetical protein
LAAFNLKRYFPALSLYHSKTGSGTISPPTTMNRFS